LLFYSMKHTLPTSKIRGLISENQALGLKHN